VAVVRMVRLTGKHRPARMEISIIAVGRGRCEVPPHDAMRRCDPHQRIEERKEVLLDGKRREAVAIIPSAHKN